MIIILQIKHYDTFNFENALRGARNPLNSWGRMDSHYDESGAYIYGENDLNLLQRLAVAGSDHRKFMRQIMLSVDILAPMYWWKEYDTYKVATTANSTSTMHKIHSKPFEQSDFSCDMLDAPSLAFLDETLVFLEKQRLAFVDSKDKQYWWNIIQLLPSSYNQLRTCTLNYESLLNIYHARKNHKLDEWKVFCTWVETLPYAKQLICINKK